MFNKTYFIRIIIIFVLFSVLPTDCDAAEDDDLVFAIGAYNDGFYDVAEQGFSSFVKKYKQSKNRPYALYLLGITYFLQDNYNNTKKTLGELVELYPKYERVNSAYYFLGEACYLTDDYDTARRSYKYVYRYPPDEASMDMVLFRLGELNFLVGDYAGAKKALFELKKLFGGFEQIDVVRFYLSFSCYYTGDYENAFNEFKYVMPKKELIKSVRADVIFFAADSAFNLKKYDSSRKYFSEFLRDYGVDKRREEARYYLAMSHYFTNNKESALKELKRYLTDHPKGKYAFYVTEQLANIYFDLKQFKNANVYLTKLISGHASSVNLTDWLLQSAWCFTNLRDHKSATAIYDRLEKMAGDMGLPSDIKFLRAESYYFSKEYYKALNIYDKLKTDPKYKNEALRKLANCHYYLDDYYMSRKYFADYIKLFPKAGDDVFLKYAISLTSELPENEHGKALEYYEKITAKKKGDYYHKTALFNAILIYDRSDSKKLYGALESYVNLKGVDVPYYFYLKLADRYYGDDKRKDAIKYYELAMKERSIDVMRESLFRLGKLYNKENDLRKSLKYYDLAEATYPRGDQSAQLFLIYMEKGDVYEKSGKKESAKKEYEKVIALSKDEELIAVAKERIKSLSQVTGEEKK